MKRPVTILDLQKVWTGKALKKRKVVKFLKIQFNLHLKSKAFLFFRFEELVMTSTGDSGFIDELL